MTTEEIANEILDAWYHGAGRHQPYERTDAIGYKKVCEAIDRLPGLVMYVSDKDQHIGPITDVAAQSMALPIECPTSATLPDELIRLLREQLLVCSRVLLTARKGYQIDYAKMSNYLAALQAVDALEKMPAVQDASIPF